MLHLEMRARIGAQALVRRQLRAAESQGKGKGKGKGGMMEAKWMELLDLVSCQ